ncbi:MAG: hypothetical protein U9N34_01465 [Candidatus Cloacimonadota bacterium]|nr:hypothetical protein [Candidatus Cloacimonadota bacterium]
MNPDEMKINYMGQVGQARQAGQEWEIEEKYAVILTYLSSCSLGRITFCNS